MPKNKSSQSALPSLLISREEAETQIKEQIRKGRRIRDADIRLKAEAIKGIESARKWENFTYELLSRLFDTTSIAREFRRAANSQPFYENSTYREMGRWVNECAASGVFALENILDRLKLIPEAANLQSASEQSSICRDVFIVHGHDEAAKQSVARFIDKLGLHAVILHEQANLNRTIIEKLERHSSVCFAVVILTPDDVGWPASDSTQAKYRARQNVIFELGYFIGKLNRDKVCALYKGDIELPSDYYGVLYVPLDPDGAWQLKLAKEIREAGIDIDLNKSY